jgi:hypothetical protein
MRYFLCLIGLTGILTFTFGMQNPVIVKSADKDLAPLCFVSSPNPPLSIIEHSGYSLTFLNFAQQSYQHKRPGTLPPGSYAALSLLNVSFLNTSYLFLARSTSFFLLYHYSLSLWEVFRH